MPPPPNPSTEKQPTVVFVAFESEYAAYGGLGAVMRTLPAEMATDDGALPSVVLAPFFPNITGLDALKKKGKVERFTTRFSFSMAVRGVAHTVDVIEVVASTGVTTYLLGAEGFFTAPSNPYVNPCDPARPLDPFRNPINPDTLTEDALFFCAAVPTALVELHREGALASDELILHLQDWETACVAHALTVTRTDPEIDSIRCVLTLHNPYDRYLSPSQSSRANDLMVHLGLSHDNVLAQTIPLVEQTLSTVSATFAEELITDPLHTSAFAPHLQPHLAAKTLVGIDNGLFGTPAFPFSKKAQNNAKKGNFKTIQQEKWERRSTLGEVLDAYQRDLAENASGPQGWGADLDLSDPAAPVFLILGRDDPRQKGFDVIAEAIRAIPEGAGRYIFTPMPGDEGLAGLSFLEDLAASRPGEVKVFPFRLSFEAFQALQKGSSFMVMGSLYEPFGAANEAYLAGMPVVARATGGLVQQVAPYPDAPYLSAHGAWLASRYHSPESKPTGFLFREPKLPLPIEAQGWRTIVDCAYWQQNPKGNRINDRRGSPLFDAMVTSAAQALGAAIDFYTSDQAGYAEMIYHGFKLLDHFSWTRAIDEYRRYLYGA